MKISTILVTHDKIDWAILLLRVTASGVFMAHGVQKLFDWFGWFGSNDFEATDQWMNSIRLDPGYSMALLAESCEFSSGLALLRGLLIRLAALATVLTISAKNTV